MDAGDADKYGGHQPGCDVYRGKREDSKYCQPGWTYAARVERQHLQHDLEEKLAAAIANAREQLGQRTS